MIVYVKINGLHSRTVCGDLVRVQQLLRDLPNQTRLCDCHLLHRVKYTERSQGCQRRQTVSI